MFKHFLMEGHQDNNPIAIEPYQADNTDSTNSPENHESDYESVLHSTIRLPKLLESSDYPYKTAVNFVEAKAEVRESEEFRKFQGENFKPESLRDSTMSRFLSVVSENRR